MGLSVLRVNPTTPSKSWTCLKVTRYCKLRISSDMTCLRLVEGDALSVYDLLEKRCIY